MQNINNEIHFLVGTRAQVGNAHLKARIERASAKIQAVIQMMFENI